MPSKNWKPRWTDCARPASSSPRSSSGSSKGSITATGDILQDVEMPGRGLQAGGLVRRLRLHVRGWAPHRMVLAIVLGIAAASFGLPRILPPLQLADESFSDLMIG